MTTLTKTGKPKQKPGTKPKTLAQHLEAGTFRHHRHKHLLSDKGLLAAKPRPNVDQTVRSQTRWITGPWAERAVKNGCRFDERMAMHVVEFFQKYLRHSKGQWAGKPFELLDWQRDDLIYPLFGWIKPDGTRLKSRVYCEVAKKNGKSTLAAAIGVYMLCGDGEPGAEVYSLASDKDQASIVHREAISMVESSDYLSKLLKVNKSTNNIKFEKTHSYYRAVSSTAGGKEGLHIHCAIIDELHVWKGRQLWDRLKYGYRSRLNPIQFCITTAGDDMQSICRKQHDYAQRVIHDDIHDEAYLPVIYAAAPGDDWLDEKVWKKANPSLGETMKIDDFKRDATEAKGSAADEMAFKRYSLNVWATVHNPYLEIGSWDKAASDVTIDQFKGQPCWLGLDLAKLHDMTALVACFRRDDSFYLFAWFWVPSTAVDKPKATVNYLDWVRSGHLIPTPGDVSDFSYPRDKIVELSRKFKIRQLAYDPWNAEQLTQELEQNNRINRVSFQQSLKNFTEPMKDFKRLLVAGTLHHDNNPIMNWQAGNVVEYSDSNNNCRPVKPKPNDERKIDGIVSGIMAFGMAQSDTKKPSVYNQRGVLQI